MRYIWRARDACSALVLLPVDFLTALIGIIVAAIVAGFLPQESRGAFWTTGLICIGLTAAMFGVTCGVSLNLH